MPSSYVKGTVVRVSGSFADISGILQDPGQVFFEYKAGASGTPTSLHYGVDTALVKDSTGKYHVDVDTSSAGGNWFYRFWSTGIGQAAQEGQFFVESNF